jgi:MraZ protein
VGRCGEMWSHAPFKTEIINIYMFQGHSIGNIDSKSRLIIPVKFRKYIKPEAQNKVVLTRGLDKCLFVYPLNIWENVKARLAKYNAFNSEQRFFLRQFLMFVNECELDSQYRILIPTQLIQFAEITKEVLILGQLDKIELWNPEITKEYEKGQPESYEAIAEKISEIFNLNNEI